MWNNVRDWACVRLKLGSFLRGALLAGGMASLTAGAAAQNAPPTVSLTSPANGASFAAPALFTYTAAAADSDGTVVSVAFYGEDANTPPTLLGTDTTAPYSLDLTAFPVGAGTYTFTARATDNSGAVTISAPITVTVTATNVAPTVSLTSPANGSSFAAPALFTYTAAAADSDGTVVSVAFYGEDANTPPTLLGTDTTAPYSLDLTAFPVGAGTYTFTARATDNSGAVTISAPITVTVTATNVAPTVSLTSPANGASFAAPALFTFTAVAADSDGTVASVEFYGEDANTPPTLLGTDTTAPYSLDLTAFPVGAGTYTFTARATDNSGAVTISAPITVTVTGSNTAPTVSLTAPANGASFTAPANITLTATAADTDGTVASVAFYNGAALLGTVTSAPYSFDWTNVAAGSYTLTARATDDGGAVTISAASTITVTGSNAAPTVSLTAPANGASFTAPANVTLTATAADTDGAIASVAFYNGATLLSTVTTAPYSFDWTNVAVGSYTLTAVATDDLGAVTTSTASTITVAGSNAAPTVSLTAPANGTSFTAPANITLTATAADTDGTIASVAFYNGATLLSTVTTAPYSFDWTNVAVGSYTLTAVATDNQSGSSTSAPVSITVQGGSQPSITYIHTDMSGSPLAATNEAGNVVWQEDYSGYGERNTQQVGSEGQAQWFHGKEVDASTGLQYFGARYYDPVVGRFMGIDPVGFQEDNLNSFNRYAYGNNNPIKYVDPDGNSPIDVAFLLWDIGKLGVAVYSGNGALIGEAAADVALSIVGVASPIPGTGQALKAARTVDRVVDAGRTAQEAGSVSKAASKIDRAVFKKDRELYWKNKAKDGSSEFKADDLARMKKGKPPIGSDGHPMELHHIDRTMEGGLKEMTRTEHRLGDNFKKNHPD